MHQSKNDDSTDLQKHLTSLLGLIKITAWRILLATPRVRATVPMLRGVWGRALKHLDEEAYRQVFVGAGPPHRRRPRYIMRPAPADPATAPAVEWIILNTDKCLDSVLWRAWDVASGMGLGPKREPFRIRRCLPLAPSSRSTRPPTEPWRLSDADWPLSGNPDTTPCRLSFPAPLRLVRRGSLLKSPHFADIVTYALRRMADLAGESRGTSYRNLMRTVRTEVDRIAASPWYGERVDLVRWSGAQQREIDLYGVAGELLLPGGPGQIWPLLAATRWTHFGKGTVFGMGELRITALEGTSVREFQ